MSKCKKNKVWYLKQNICHQNIDKSWTPQTIHLKLHGLYIHGTMELNHCLSCAFYGKKKREGDTHKTVKIVQIIIEATDVIFMVIISFS